MPETDTFESNALPNSALQHEGEPPEGVDPTSESTVEEVDENTIKAKLIHTSSKLFWRQKATYEFHFFECLDTDYIQMLYINPESDENHVSLFLSYAALHPMVAAESAHLLSVRIKKMDSIRQRAPRGTSFVESDALLLHDITMKAMSEYVIQHFAIDKDEGTGVVVCKLNPNASEGAGGVAALTLQAAPAHPTDAKVARKRRSSTVEIHALMSDLKAETSSLKLATSQATRMANLGTMAVGGFQAAMKGRGRLRSKSIDVNNMTPAKLRWQKAIHRVVMQNAVAKYAEMIAQSKCCNPARVDTPTRLRGSRSTFPASDGFLPLSNQGTPTAKPSPLDMGGFGKTSAAPPKAKKMLQQSNSMPLPTVKSPGVGGVGVGEGSKISPVSIPRGLNVSPMHDDGSLPVLKKGGIKSNTRSDPTTTAATTAATTTTTAATTTTTGSRRRTSKTKAS